MSSSISTTGKFMTSHQAGGYRTVVIWMTGLSGAGKTTLATLLDQQFTSRGYHSIIVDGDVLRAGISKDLGFSPQDRTENIRRAAELAKLLKESGSIVIASLISPLKSDRQMARHIVGPGFIEVFVDCPLEECIQRDVKGLYAKALEGEIQNFTGISAEYERPENPELILNTQEEPVSETMNRLIHYLLPLIETKITFSEDRE